MALEFVEDSKKRLLTSLLIALLLSFILTYSSVSLISQGYGGAGQYIGRFIVPFVIVFFGVNAGMKRIKLDSKKTEKEKKELVAPWLKPVSYIIVVLLFVLNGFALWALIGGIIGISCGNRCSRWAAKIKKDPNVAYVVGFVFGILGLFGYWIYYKVKKFKKK